MEKIGIDVHKVATQVCIMTEDGEFKEFRIRIERDSLTETFGRRVRARILLEAATESEWVARHLEALGHEVIVADPNFAPMYASRSRKVKTDKRDARALCEACQLGAYRAVHRVSDGSRMLRKQLASRAVLVQTRSRMISLCRALLRQEGIRVPSGGAVAFDKRVRALTLSAELRRTLQPLLKTHAHLCEQIKCLDALIAKALKHDERAQRLTSVPSVGPVTALSFVALVGERAGTSVGSPSLVRYRATLAPSVIIASSFMRAWHFGQSRKSMSKSFLEVRPTRDNGLRVWLRARHLGFRPLVAAACAAVLHAGATGWPTRARRRISPCESQAAARWWRAGTAATAGPARPRPCHPRTRA